VTATVVPDGESQRWGVISQAQAYHGALLGAFVLAGRSSLQRPYGEYRPGDRRIPPARGSDGREVLAALDSAIAGAGPETVAALFCVAEMVERPVAAIAAVERRVGEALG
jgi:adenosylmethionine-8-amino-7-oxononanoate aminotransferase